MDLIWALINKVRMTALPYRQSVCQLFLMESVCDSSEKSMNLHLPQLLYMYKDRWDKCNLTTHYIHRPPETEGLYKPLVYELRIRGIAINLFIIFSLLQHVAGLINFYSILYCFLSTEAMEWSLPSWQIYSLTPLSTKKWNRAQNNFMQQWASNFGLYWAGIRHFF